MQQVGFTQKQSTLWKKKNKKKKSAVRAASQQDKPAEGFFLFTCFFAQLIVCFALSAYVRCCFIVDESNATAMLKLENKSKFFESTVVNELLVNEFDQLLENKKKELLASLQSQSSGKRKSITNHPCLNMNFFSMFQTLKYRLQAVPLLRKYVLLTFYKPLNFQCCTLLFFSSHFQCVIAIYFGVILI